MTQTRSLALLGRDFPELGPLASTGLPDGGAISLSRGAYPKPYRHVDPNEDAALIARTPSGVLLAVADGRHGATASELAIEAVRLRAAELIPLEGSDFTRGIRLLVEQMAHERLAVGRSRTCLAIATLRHDTCHFALFGDCSIWRTAETEAQSTPNDLILGGDLSLEGIPETLWAGTFTRATNERVVLVSDGVTNFLADPHTIPSLLRAAPSDLEAVRTLTQRAMSGGAGDNIAVAAASLS